MDVYVLQQWRKAAKGRRKVRERYKYINENLIIIPCPDSAGLKARKEQREAGKLGKAPKIGGRKIGCQTGRKPHPLCPRSPTARLGWPLPTDSVAVAKVRFQLQHVADVRGLI